MRHSNYVTAWECCFSKYVSAWKRCSLSHYNPKPPDSASNITFFLQPYFKPHLLHAVTYFEPKLSYAITYLEPRISHATLFWLQNHANIIFDTHFQKLNDFSTIFFNLFKRTLKNKTSLLPLIWLVWTIGQFLWYCMAVSSF